MLQFRLLGTLEAGDDGPLQLGSGKQRALLAYLLLHRNVAVPRQDLIDVLWPNDPPATAAHALDVYVSRLRRSLGIGGSLEARGGALQLNVSDDDLDAARFERLVVAARAAASPAQRMELLDDALALWRGRALADVLGEEFARRESERLEEERLLAVELRLESLLELGRHQEAVGPLHALSREGPLRERPRRLLMVALYRTGRQHDALEVYREFRTLVRDELGLEPSPELRQLEAAVLRHDPSLSAPSPPREGEPALPAQGRRRRMLGAVIALVVIAAGTTLGLLLASSSGPANLRVQDQVAAAIDPETGRVVTVVPLHGQPIAAVGTGDTVWIASSYQRTLTRIDDLTGEVTATIGLPAQPLALAVGAGRIWVASRDRRYSLTAVDPRSGEIVLTIPLHQPGLGQFSSQGWGANGVAFGSGSVWASVGVSGLMRIRPDGKVLHTYVVGPEPAAVAAGGGSVWTAVIGPAQVVQVDPRNDSVESRVTVGYMQEISPVSTNLACTIAVSGQSLWVPSTGQSSADRGVWRIDALRGVVISVLHPGGSPCTVSIGHGRVWVANPNGFEVDEIDPETGSFMRIPTNVPPNTVVVARTHVWITTN